MRRIAQHADQKLSHRAIDHFFDEKTGRRHGQGSLLQIVMGQAQPNSAGLGLVRQSLDLQHKWRTKRLRGVGEPVATGPDTSGNIKTNCGEDDLGLGLAHRGGGTMWAGQKQP